MSFAVRRAVAIALPIFVLPIAAQAAPKIGTVTSSNNAVVARDGKVMPATSNMPLQPGDKVMTRDGGAAEVQLADRSVHLGSSSMLSTNDGRSLSMDPKASSTGGRNETAQQLASAERDHRHDNGDDDNDGDHDNGNHFGHCTGKGHDHHDDDGPGRGHGHGHDHDCPPVSP
jgi:hypothetical protein